MVMKKNLLLFVALFVSILFFVSCGSSSGLGKHKDKSPAQEYVEAKNRNTLRAWGQYNGFPDQNLEAFAAAQAKADLVKKIETYVGTYIEMYDGTYQASEVSGGESDRAKDDGGKDTNTILEAAENTLQGCSVVMSDRYVQKDGTETCYLAVEISPETVINYIKTNKKFNDALSKEKKEEIRYDSERSKESMLKAFEELKKGNKL